MRLEWYMYDGITKSLGSSICKVKERAQTNNYSVQYMTVQCEPNSI